MENCRGLPIVSHEDLKQAVLNWREAKALWKSYSEGLVKQRVSLWRSLPIHKRFWFQFKSGIYTPTEYFEGTEEWQAENFPICLRGKLYRYVSHNGGWWCTERFTSEECYKHSMSFGTHYLNPEQVVFVEKFKYLNL